MNRFPFASLLLAVTIAVPARAQERATVMISHASPDAVQDALGRELSAQGFTVRDHNRKHVVFSADKGNTMLTDGTQLKLRYELDFQMKPEKDSLRVWLARETLVGEARDGNDRRQEQNPDKNRTSFQGILNSVKASLESPPADSSGS